MKVTNDVERGRWLTERAQGERLGAIVGRGFEAYVRILHPVPQEYGTPDDIPPLVPWHERRWADVAARNGYVMHPLVQWWRIVGATDASAGSTSDVGRLDLEALAALVPAFRGATSTPDDLVAGFWAGGDGQDLEHTHVLDASRDFVLVETSLDEIADADWASSLGLDESQAIRPAAVQVLWPEDRAWVLGTEIDFDSTIVAGSRGLIDAILSDHRFEAFEVGEDADLSWLGDTVNAPA